MIENNFFFINVNFDMVIVNVCLVLFFLGGLVRFVVKRWRITFVRIISAVSSFWYLIRGGRELFIGEFV